MKRTAPTTIGLVMLASLGSHQLLAAVKHLPEDVKASLRDASGFRIQTSVAAIPISARVSLARALGDEPLAIAEPDAEWQATDVVQQPGLPHRRLKSVALSRSLCVLFYERGGRAHSYHVVVFRLSSDTAQLVWRAQLDEAIATPASLLQAIDAGKVEDDPTYLF